MKGQAAIMDALIFMMIVSGAASLLLFVSGLFATSTNNQLITIYNYEYGTNALIAMHYAKDMDGNWFWNELRHKLIMRESIKTYLDGKALSVYQNLTYSSPAGANTFLCFNGAPTGLDGDCYPTNPNLLEDAATMTVYASSVKITPDIDIIIKLYY
jgi:hypothetical protein